MVEKINQEDWNGVYYDVTVGEFYMMDVRENEVVFINPFIGDEVETIGLDEFNDLHMDNSFQQVSKDVVNNPSSLVETLLYETTNAVSGDSSGFREYDAHNVDFAITATNLSFDSDAPYANM